jgi:hypothetical protein
VIRSRPARFRAGTAAGAWLAFENDMSIRIWTVAWAMAMALAACSGSKGGMDAAADGVDADLRADADLRLDAGEGPPDGGGCAADARFDCALAFVADAGGTECSDATTPAACVDGAWRCRAGEVPISECDCVGGPLLGCDVGKVCTASGWVCPDAGTD